MYSPFSSFSPTYQFSFPKIYILLYILTVNLFLLYHIYIRMICTAALSFFFTFVQKVYIVDLDHSPP